MTCQSCTAAYPIIEGIPLFNSNSFCLHAEFVRKYADKIQQSAQLIDKATIFSKIHGQTQERFGHEWMNYPGPMAEDRKIFLEETQIPQSDWAGKTVLDAGCGMGRYTRIAHDLGAHVIAMDLSHALIRLQEAAFNSDRMHLIQGNLLSIPLKEESLDTAYSIGVIHHTPSAKEAARQLAKTVKPGGHLSFWVYGTAGSFKHFQTNPLRKDRTGLKKIILLAWFIVGIRQFISDFLRVVTIRISHKCLYLLCYPLALLGKIPFIKYLTFSVHPLWRVRLQENFDWLSPPYQSHHTKEEIIQWIQEEGFDLLKILPHGFVPKPGVLGKKMSIRPSDIKK